MLMLGEGGIETHSSATVRYALNVLRGKGGHSGLAQGLMISRRDLKCSREAGESEQVGLLTAPKPAYKDPKTR
jgi:hypothetical protein